MVSDTPNWAWVYSLVNWGTEIGGQDLEIITFYNIELTTSTSSSLYAIIEKNLSLETRMNPYPYQASYTWSMVSGPGDVTFSSPSSSSTDFLADTLGTYQIQCECLVDGADDSYTLELEIKVVNVEFFKTGTQDPITEAHVGTDGDVNTTQGGEEKDIDIKITPSDLELDFSLSNTEAEINTSSGSGTTTVKITGKGDGLEDSELYVKDGDIEVISLSIQVHKPHSVVLKETTDITVSPQPNAVGTGQIYEFKVVDIQGHEIPSLEGYNIYERLHFDENQNGLGGLFVATYLMDFTEYPGTTLATSTFVDIIQLWLRANYCVMGFDAKLTLRNSFYMLDIYLEGSTYTTSFISILGPDNYVLNLFITDREQLNDSALVTIEDDQID